MISSWITDSMSCASVTALILTSLVGLGIIIAFFLRRDLDAFRPRGLDRRGDETKRNELRLEPIWIGASVLALALISIWGIALIAPHWPLKSSDQAISPAL